MSDPSWPQRGLLPFSGLKPNPKAPSLQHSVFTRASCELAWKVFADCKLWAGFFENYEQRARWNGIPWNPGSRLQFGISTPEQIPVESVVTLCAPPQCAAWINNVCGSSLPQCVLFEPYIGGGTKITTWIELGDAGLQPTSGRTRSVLKALLHTWFNNFVAECDHRARVAASVRVSDSPIE